MAFARSSGLLEHNYRRENWIQVPKSSRERNILSAQRFSEPNAERNKRIDCLLTHFDHADAINRNPFETFIMLLGDTGAGKSSTINHLMNNKMIPTSDTGSKTRSVTGYQGKYNVEKLWLSDLKINFVDTPGFFDTEGLPQDACNLWAIHKYCSEKIRAYPNVILLCVKATENRFEGEKSSFVKCLQILQAMNVIDKQKVNVILVLTNVCSLPQKREIWEKKISEKAQKINQVLQRELGFLARIAYIENHIDEYDLQRMFPVNFSFLPDRSIQPLNLFFKILLLLKNNGDELGYSTFEQVYNERKLGKRFVARGSVPAKIASQHRNELDKEENQCLVILEDVVGSSDALKKLKAQFDKVHDENEVNKRLQMDQEREARRVYEILQKTQEELADRRQQMINARALREEMHEEEKRRMDSRIARSEWQQRQTMEEVRLTQKKAEEANQRFERAFGNHEKQRRAEALERERQLRAQRMSYHQKLNEEREEAERRIAEGCAEAQRQQNDFARRLEQQGSQRNYELQQQIEDLRTARNREGSDSCFLQ